MPRESEQATREEAGPPQMDDGEGVPENVARGNYALHDDLHSGAVSALHRGRSARRFVTAKVPRHICGRHPPPDVMSEPTDGYIRSAPIAAARIEVHFRAWTCRDGGRMTPLERKKVEETLRRLFDGDRIALAAAVAIRHYQPELLSWLN